MSLFDEWQKWHRDHSQHFVKGTLWHQDQPAGKLYLGVIERIEIDATLQEAHFYTSQIESMRIDLEGQPLSSQEPDTFEGTDCLKAPLREGPLTPSQLTPMPDGSVYFPYGHAWIILLPTAPYRPLLQG